MVTTDDPEHVSVAPRLCVLRRDEGDAWLSRGAAERAGLLDGDRVLEVNGHFVDDAPHLETSGFEGLHQVGRSFNGLGDLGGGRRDELHTGVVPEGGEPGLGEGHGGCGAQRDAVDALRNTLVATEVLMWFYIGECIGKGGLVGYAV
ncbi:hypothetical protein CRUP_005523 [Coryphaenoides rupestris]|nr:hypothetical protein CRUP_005523 [Coryphaenoides rupestris]